MTSYRPFTYFPEDINSKCIDVMNFFDGDFLIDSVSSLNISLWHTKELKYLIDYGLVTFTYKGSLTKKSPILYKNLALTFKGMWLYWLIRKDLVTW